MLGSWAGAMGQNQFMPSSFMQYAVDYDGDGRPDIWTTLADVFASTANYLASSGWRTREPWGHRVVLPAHFEVTTNAGQPSKTLADWQALGVQRVDGSAFPAEIEAASLVLPSGTTHPAFLVYPNYQVVLKWNRSHYFALTVSQFADQLGRK
jgi:membrane-bound lytic murein transglycosylase B